MITARCCKSGVTVIFTHRLRGQQIRTKAQKSNHKRVQSLTYRKKFKILKPRLDTQMYHPIRQRCRETKHHPTIGYAVPSADDPPSEREFILSHFTVEDELIDRRLHRGRSGVKFIKK